MSSTAQMTALILDGDTLRAAGLRHILHSFHDIEVRTPGITDADTPALTSAGAIFVTPETLTAVPDLLLPHRHKTVLITPRPTDAFTTLDPTLPHDRLIEAVATIVATLSIDNPAGQGTLSAREVDVLRLVARGHINKEIADILGISFNTVLTHRRNITSKLGIRSVSGLGVYAVMNGLISPADIENPR